MIILFILLIAIIFLLIVNHKTLQETKELATNVSFDKITEALPNNEEICKEIQKQVGHECEIQLDSNAKSSAYIFFQDKMILSDTESSRKNYTRVLFIAHECVHSVQDKKTHWINFTLANIKNLYDFILFILLLFGKGSLELIMISFLISFLSFYYRIILEADAVYRSVMVSKKYLGKKNLDSIAEKYEEIIPKTIAGMYFSYISPILIKLAVFVLMNCII